MPLLEEAFGVVTLGIVATGLAMVGLSVRAYRRRPERTFVFLAVGFAIVVAATAATGISAFLLRFDSGQLLLVVNNGLTLLGILLVVFGLLSHR